MVLDFGFQLVGFWAQTFLTCEASLGSIRPPLLPDLTGSQPNQPPSQPINQASGHPYVLWQAGGPKVIGYVSNGQWNGVSLAV